MLANVRYDPASGHGAEGAQYLISAISYHSAPQQNDLFDHLVGGGEQRIFWRCEKL